ncbi:MAG: NAD-dependent epimerase/dehydratase family protein, partial [Acidimicrobiales bacterium]
MTVLVTGAAGFIGSTLCEKLLATGWSVRALDAFTENYDARQKHANLAGVLDHPNFTLLQADLVTDPLKGVLDGVDAVVHLAAEPGVSPSWGPGFGRYVERNVHATQRLLDACAPVALRRFVFASSSSVYGDGVTGPVPESTMPRPASPYGVTKLAAEHLVGAYAARGLPAVSLRYFSVYGPRQRPDMALHRFIEAALDQCPLTVYGDGSQVRDLTHVADAVAATMAALTADLDAGAVLNIAGGTPASVGDLVALVGRSLGGIVEIEHRPGRPGDVARTEGSLEAAGRLLRWQPAVGLAEGVARQVEWHLRRRSGNAPRANGAADRARAPARPERRRPRDGSRLLIYTQDGLGLGHLRRASALATGFLRGNERGSVLTISDSPLGTMLRGLPNHDYLKLPSIVKAGPGDWRSLALPLAFPEVLQLRSRVILDAARAFRPDVMLVDHMPHGAMGELTRTLDALAGGPTRIVLGLRDIIDAPDVVDRRWKAEGAYDVLRQYYDQVLVYGSREVFDLPAEYQWSSGLARAATFCGYVCTPELPDHPARVRSRQLDGLAGGRLIVAMAGGGADGYELMSTLLDAVPDVAAALPVAVVAVTGPFMPEAQRRDLKLRAAGLSRRSGRAGPTVKLRTTVSDPLTYAAAADLVVSMAGYNTTMEVLRVGTPALLVPRRGPSEEQRMRAARFAERGWVSQLDP